MYRLLRDGNVVCTLLIRPVKRITHDNTEGIRFLYVTDKKYGINTLLKHYRYLLEYLERHGQDNCIKQCLLRKKNTEALVK